MMGRISEMMGKRMEKRKQSWINRGTRRMENDVEIINGDCMH